MQNSVQQLDLRELFRILAFRRWWIACGFFLGAVVGFGVALSATPMYRADVLLQPLKRAGGGGAMQALAGQMGGLASLAGFALGGADDTATSVATLKSRVLTQSFIAEKNLLPVLYADQWDAKTGNWKNPDPDRIPTIWAAEQMFSRRIRKVNESRATGLVSMTIEWSDPKLAAEWARELVVRTNDLLRAQAYENAQNNIAFLQKQLETTGIVEVRQSLNSLLEEQWKQLMLTQGDTEYAFKTIDPAVVPEAKINLSRKLVVLAWVAAGLLFACIAALAERLVWERNRP